ncbi:hypothetical protein [Amycolatopsis antarctica]|nr:hypothetical protein [Amycolatopsis antarctica]
MTGRAEYPGTAMAVEVDPGGALRSVSLSGTALRLGPIGLAARRRWPR